MQITLYFADFNATALGERVFDIQINEQTVATYVDVYALGGGDYSAVSVAVPAFYSGSRSTFDIALPMVVSFSPLKQCLSLCICIFCCMFKAIAVSFAAPLVLNSALRYIPDLALPTVVRSSGARIQRHIRM